MFKSIQLQTGQSATSLATAPSRIVQNVEDLQALTKFLKFVLAGLISSGAEDPRAERCALIASVCRVLAEAARSSPTLLEALFELALTELEAFLLRTTSAAAAAAAAATAASDSIALTPSPIQIQSSIGGGLLSPSLGFGSASEAQTRESEHPYSDNTSRSGRVRFPGAARIRIEFDPRCSTESRHDPLTILDLYGIQIIVECSLLDFTYIVLQLTM